MQSNYSSYNSSQFCPQPGCGLRMIRNGTTSAGNQRYRCLPCRTTTTDSPPPLLDGMTTDLKKITVAIKLMSEGVSINSTSRMTGLAVPTILKLIEQAGHRAEIAMDKYLAGIRCRSLQIDELWTFVHTKQRRLKPGDPAEYGDQWIFIALDADTKLAACHHIGKRDLDTGTVFFKVLKDRVRGRTQITTDAWPAYPDLVEDSFGNRASYAQTDGAVTWNNPNLALVSTAFVERFNLTLRMCTRRLTRKCNGFSKKLDMLSSAISLFVGYYNFCRIHETLRVTPAMEAKITDHMWTIEELLLAG